VNLPFFIAKRYLLSKRKRSFINIISILSLIGVAFSTAALIIVLSVFNGLEHLIRSLNTSFDPELKIEAAQGKSFEFTSELKQKINSIKGVEIVTEVIEDYALARYREADMVVTIKGMSDNFLDQHRLDNRIVDGKLRLHENNINYAIVGRGVQDALSIGVESNIYPLQVFYIKNLKATSLDVSNLYSRRDIQPGSVFSIEKNYDENYVFLPLDFVQDLLDYGNKRTSLEIKTKAESNLKQIQHSIKETLGNSFTVLTNEEQHKDFYKLLKMEKLFFFIALTMLIFVASVNIFFSLMMLAIDKKKDMAILSAMGATHQVIKAIFLTEGAMIALWGAAIGLVLGGGVCWLQDRFGLVGMGMENAIVNSYPVKLKAVDFGVTSLVIIAITFVISFYPARLAAKTFTTNQL
jgi:lipoprotein-releasing system permease protein